MIYFKDRFDLDFEGAFESTGKKASKGTDQRSKQRQHHGMAKERTEAEQRLAMQQTKKHRQWTRRVKLSEEKKIFEKTANLTQKKIRLLYTWSGRRAEWCNFGFLGSRIPPDKQTWDVP